VAAAVRDADGRARAAISVAVPAHRLPDEDIPALGELVSRVVGQLNAAPPDAVLGA
jgi:IclR family acetate operon transcriptional repressor